jgi:hypothetical protein
MLIFQFSYGAEGGRGRLEKVLEITDQPQELQDLRWLVALSCHALFRGSFLVLCVLLPIPPTSIFIFQIVSHTYYSLLKGTSTSDSFEALFDFM